MSTTAFGYGLANTIEATDSRHPLWAEQRRRRGYAFSTSSATPASTTGAAASSNGRGRACWPDCVR